MRCDVVLLLIATSSALSEKSDRCGSGPFLVSRRSEEFTVYQRNQWDVMISTNDQAEGRKFGWFVKVGNSNLKLTELNNYTRSHFTQSTRNGRVATSLIVNLTRELSGVHLQFRFYPPEGSNLTEINGRWVELLVGVPPTIFLNHTSPYPIYLGQNVSVCGYISGTPSPSATIIRISDQATIPPSLFKYNSTCWLLDSSVVKYGGRFTIVARNCLSSINASFSITILNPPKISLDQAQPYEIKIQGKVNASVCVNMRDFPNPIPILTLVRASDRTKIPHSLYKYDGKCLTIDNSAVRGGGRFVIEARNDQTIVNTSFLVLAKPMIDLHLEESRGCLRANCKPQLLLALTGDNIVIPYDMAGYPLPRLRWLKRSNNYSGYDDIKSRMRNSTHLLLSNVTNIDSGLYRVRLDNRVGSHKETFKLEVTSSQDLVNMCLDKKNKNMCTSDINIVPEIPVSAKPVIPSTEWVPPQRSTQSTTEAATLAVVTATSQEAEITSPDLKRNATKATDAPPSAVATLISQKSLDLKRNVTGATEGPTSAVATATSQETEMTPPNLERTATKTTEVPLGGNSSETRSQSSSEGPVIPYWIIGAACGTFLIAAICITTLSCRAVRVRRRKMTVSSTNNTVEEQEQPKWADTNINTTKDAYESAEKRESGYEEGDSVSTSIEKRIDKQIRKGRQKQNVRFTPGEAMSDRHGPGYTRLWESCERRAKGIELQDGQAAPSETGQSHDILEYKNKQQFIIEKRLSARSDTTAEYPELEFVSSNL